MELFKGQIKDFDITQISSNNGKNFPTLHQGNTSSKVFDKRYIFLGIRI